MDQNDKYFDSTKRTPQSGVHHLSKYISKDKGISYFQINSFFFVFTIAIASQTLSSLFIACISHTPLLRTLNDVPVRVLL